MAAGRPDSPQSSHFSNHPLSRHPLSSHPLSRHPLSSYPLSSHPLSSYEAASGRFEPVWTLEIQSVADDVDNILDAAVAVYPLTYGRYERNASVSAVGVETARPCEGSTTASHIADFTVGSVETFPVVEIKISIERDPDVLAAVMGAVMHVHHYEEPVIFLREDWASRSAYNPDNDNPNRWWNNGRGLPERIS